MAALALVNPRKRGRKRRVARRAVRRLSSVTSRAVTRRYRRNPIKRGGKIMDTAKKGMIGATGALAVDVVIQKLPMIPANFRTGVWGALTKGVIGVTIGAGIAAFTRNKKLGAELADGAVTVALYNAGKSVVGPQLGISGYDDGLLGYDDDGLLGYYSGMDDDDDDDAMGYYSAASTYDSAFDE